MLCPLRVETHAYEKALGEGFWSAMEKVTEPVFLPCYEDECMFYNCETRKCDAVMFAAVKQK